MEIYLKRIALLISILGVIALCPVTSRALTLGADSNGATITGDIPFAFGPYGKSQNIALVTGVAQYITPPTGYNHVLMSCGSSDFWVQAYAATTSSGLAVPTVTNTAGANPTKDPSMRKLTGVATIGIILDTSAASPTECSFDWYP